VALFNLLDRNSYSSNPAVSSVKPTPERTIRRQEDQLSGNESFEGAVDDLEAT